VHESGLALFTRRPSARRRNTANKLRHDNQHLHHHHQQEGATMPEIAPSAPTRGRWFGGGCMSDVPGPKDAWMVYCWVLTWWVPNAFLRVCGMRTPEQRRAWREKMGLVGIIACLMAAVGYITFGFTQTVCGRPVNRFHGGQIDTGSVIVHGYDYDFSKFNHPRAGATFPTATTNPLFEGNWHAGGNDISFMFQRVNERCMGFISKASGSPVGGTTEKPQRYFPCNIFSQNGQTSFNTTLYGGDTNCHLSNTARGQMGSFRAQGQVYYTWDDVKRSDRNLAVFES
jgi:chitin synthase